MDQELMRATLEVEDHHWWYQGRRRIIRAELDRLPLPRPAKVLDAGCGSGRTLLELVDYGHLSGIELDPDVAAVAQGRGLGEVVQGRLEELPWAENTFDLITCLDVIEHTPDDRRTLRELLRVCRPGGFLLVTVPAHQCLWSAHDEYNHHYRRYSRRSLRDAATAAGWGLGRISAFNSLLLPPAAVVRLLRRRAAAGADANGNGRSGRAAGDDLFTGPRWLNKTLEGPLRLEARWLAHGLTLPLGLSLLVVLRKPWTAT
jgi:SAM-dependent methyltransferase